MDNLLLEYKKSLKSIDAEERLDIYFFRPIAFLIVKLLYPLPISPNGYSALALFFGILSAFEILKNTSHHFIMAGIYFFISSVIDCCDGMVARLKKNGTPYGKIVDGVVDYLVNILVFGSLISISPFYLKMMILFAAFSKILHSLIYDHYLSIFLNSKNITNHQSKNIFVRIFSFYVEAQSKILGNNKVSLKNLQDLSFIGPTTHNFFFIMSVILNSVWVYVIFSLLFANGWLIRFMFKKDEAAHLT